MKFKMNHSKRIRVKHRKWFERENVYQNPPKTGKTSSTSPVLGLTGVHILIKILQCFLGTEHRGIVVDKHIHIEKNMPCTVTCCFNILSGEGNIYY